LLNRKLGRFGAFQNSIDIVSPKSSQGWKVANAAEAVLNRQLSHLQHNINRLRRDLRLQAWEMPQLIDADLDCTAAAQLLMRMQADLVLFIEKRERLMA
jgi:hypothetical protein